MIYVSCNSQDDKLKKYPLKLNNINIELCGTGLGYSINYDRVFPFGEFLKYSLTIGYEYYIEHYFICQYSLLIGSNHNIEVGFGYLYCITNSNLQFGKVKSLRIGYRFENILRKGFVFKIGFTPILNYELDINPPGSYIGGIALGYNF